MGLKREEDILPSSSSVDYWKSADHGKKEALRNELNKRGEKIARQEMELKTALELQQLHAQLAGKMDEEKKRAEDDDDKVLEAGTKTLKQQEEQSEDDTYTALTPEEMMEQERRKERTEDQADQEYQSQVG